MGNVSFIDGHIDEPKKITDNEIINVLEICVNKTDVFVIHHNAETREYDKISIKDILGVINHQKAEIENYKQIAENQQSVSMDKEVEIKRLKAEIERLQAHIKEGIDLAKQIPEMMSIAQAEAVKEFAEEAKQRASMISFGDPRTEGTWINTKDIDNLLKEKVGEQRKEDEKNGV